MDLEQIQRFNPWWTRTEFRFSEEGRIAREPGPHFQDFLKSPQMVALLGLRRVGKTTLMEQTINQLLESGISARRVLYFSFEEYLGKTDPQILERLILLYLEQFLKIEIHNLRETVWLFLDEIQYINHWQDILKKYYDLNQKIKFVISGSFSAIIRKKATESLAGRIFEVHLPPFSFSEYCRLEGRIPTPPSMPAQEILFSSPDRLREIMDFGALYQKRVEDLYAEYLYKGQFPETIRMTNDVLIHQYISGSILKKILTEDAPRIFSIEKPGELAALFRILSRETGNLFEITNLASEVGISKDTLNRYLECLEHLFLLSRVTNYTKKLRRQYRISKKIYVSSPCFTCNELSLTPASPLFQTIIGSLAETALFQLLNHGFERVSFWRLRKQEVDFVVESSPIFPIEMKWVGKIKSQDYRTLLSFMTKNKLERGALITKNETGEISLGDLRKITLIPLWALGFA